MQQAQQHIEGEDFAWLAAAACQLFHIPHDTRLLRQQFPPPHDRSALIKALRSYGLRAELRPVSLAELPRLAGPAFLAVAASDGADDRLCFVLMLRCDAERIVLLESGAVQPAELPMADFTARYRGEALQVAAAEPSLAEPDAAARPEAFGFRWFVPELLRHKAV